MTDVRGTCGASKDALRTALYRPKGGRRPMGIVAAAILALLMLASFQATVGHAGTPATPSAFTITIRTVRTAATTASVLGTSDALNLPIDVLVNGALAKSSTTLYNGDYWFLDLAVSDGATVQTRILGSTSPIASVPAFVPQLVGPPGFIYAKGASLLRDGQPVQLSGVDEQGAFIYGMIASGLWGVPNPSSFWGNNQLFPSGPGTKIPNVNSSDSLWREFFRYFLHYNQVAGGVGYPKVNLLRIWIVDETWYPEGTYLAWKNNPAVFFDLFDRMVYWAKRAGVYLVPVLGHFSDPKDNRFFTLTDIRYAHHIALVRALMDRYDNESQIAMWDLWNEPDVNDDAYWASVGGITGFRAWAGTYIADVKPHSANHLLTMGIGGWTLFPGVPDFGWQQHFFFNDIPGLDVSHHHSYGTAEDQYLIDWETAWHKALGRPHYEGEYGYNLYPGPSPLGYGYWPWYASQTLAAGWGAISTMVFVDNGRGPYTDYPYLGELPNYPSGNSTDIPPTARFTFAPTGPTVQQTVSFAGSTSTDDHGIRDYAWTFGDGTGANGPSVAHGYASTGDFAATLVVTDTAGQTGSMVKTVHVTTANVDTTAPATVTDLRVISSGSAGVTLRWTAPGDDGTSGKATWYDLRYTATGPIVGWNFYAAVHVEIPFPQAAGWPEQATVTGLTPGPTYWFALKTSDEVPNWSGVSNSPSGATADVVSPATIADLRVAGVGRTYVTLAWTAPGDDVNSGKAMWYDLRYSTVGPITESNFYAAVHYEIFFPSAPGTAERATVSGLHRGTRYWFAIKASDEVPNWSTSSNSPSVTTRSWRCVACGVGLPSDILDVEGLGDLLVAALAILGLAGAFLALPRDGTKPTLPRDGPVRGRRGRDHANRK